MDDERKEARTGPEPDSTAPPDAGPSGPVDDNDNTMPLDVIDSDDDGSDTAQPQGVENKAAGVNPVIPESSDSSKRGDARLDGAAAAATSGTHYQNSFDMSFMDDDDGFRFANPFDSWHRKKTFTVIGIVVIGIVVIVLGGFLFKGCTSTDGDAGAGSGSAVESVAADDGSGSSDETDATDETDEADEEDSESDADEDDATDDEDDSDSTYTAITDKSSSSDSSSGSSSSSSSSHTHDWDAVYELVDVPAKTHTVHHDAVYGTETVYETVCNTCNEIITGETQEHAEETGHTSYTTKVPIVNETIEQEAYDETVVDEEAYVELVHTEDKCATCGAVRDVDDEVVQTMSGSTKS